MEIANAPGVSDLLGAVDRETMLALPEYQERYDAYMPAGETMERIASAASGFSVVAAVASWCGDSRREVPRFLKIIDALSALGVTVKYELTACDRSKQLPPAFIDAFAIESVPTFVVFAQGREVGRIVERPVTRLEEDLLRLVERSA